ncbi:hypothetical protein [Streptosporangium vulgare]|uniref:Uncharacterized protein n=1 Tax=Streptosporangium vulgare TaxID=46190 RepID=A0ABV5TT20_9ACTN
MAQTESGEDSIDFFLIGAFDVDDVVHVQIKVCESGRQFSQRGQRITLTVRLIDRQVPDGQLFKLRKN